jgi:DNA-binding HxlR family transcriptional regulator
LRHHFNAPKSKRQTYRCQSYDGKDYASHGPPKRGFEEIGFPGLSGKCRYSSRGSFDRLNKYWLLTAALAVFSSAETIFAVIGSASMGGPAQSSLRGASGFFWQYSVPLGLAGWVFVGISIVGGQHSSKSKIKGIFAKRGFGSEVFDLMIGMRGGGSRLTLLREMQEPRHRQELAEVTGIDWKEVDRQISVLEKYGLVKVYAESGTVKMYHITEQGKLLLGLMADLQSPRQQL